MIQSLQLLFGGHERLVGMLRDLGVALLVGALGTVATQLATHNPALAIAFGVVALAGSFGLEWWLRRRAATHD